MQDEARSLLWQDGAYEARVTWQQEADPSRLPRPRRVCWLHWPGRTLRHRDRQPIRVAGMQRFRKIGGTTDADDRSLNTATPAAAGMPFTAARCGIPGPCPSRCRMGAAPSPSVSCPYPSAWSGAAWPTSWATARRARFTPTAPRLRRLPAASCGLSVGRSASCSRMMISAARSRRACRSPMRWPSILRFRKRWC